MGARPAGFSEMDWYPANNGNGKMKWFLVRDNPIYNKISDRYLLTKNGQYRKFSSYETALRAAQKINKGVCKR